MIKACAEKNGITLNLARHVKQLSAAQLAALKQCVVGSVSSGGVI